MWKAKQLSLKQITVHFANANRLIAIRELCKPHEGSEYALATAHRGGRFRQSFQRCSSALRLNVSVLAWRYEMAVRVLRQGRKIVLIRSWADRRRCA